MIATMAEAPTTKALTAYCDTRIHRRDIHDFDGARNGLQLENRGEVTRIGAAVDAGLLPFQMAVEAGVDFLIVHHGLFWNPPIPLTGVNYRKIKLAMDHNLAVYGAHLPLDAHPEIGNNALLAEALELEKSGTFLPYEGTDIGLLAHGGMPRSTLANRLKRKFQDTFTAIEAGPETVGTIAILTGSGASALSRLPAGVDTLVTGELRQHHFNMAQELGLNVYPCGHYATETFGVKALARELAARFDLPWQFIETHCPL